MMPELADRVLIVEKDVASLGARFEESMGSLEKNLTDKIDGLSSHVLEKFDAINGWIREEPKRRHHYDVGWQDGIAGLEKTTELRHQDNISHQQETEKRLGHLEILAIQQKTSVRVITILASFILFIITVGGAICTAMVAVVGLIWWIYQHVPIK